MKIVTRTLSKNHNVTQESDTRIFFRYVGFFVALFVFLYVFFWCIAVFSIQFISLDQEKTWFPESIQQLGTVEDLPEILAERYQNIPHDIHLIDMDGEKNAFAFLGGRVFVTKTLLEEMKYVEELDFIIGHELSHIEHRDVLRGMMTDIPFMILLTVFGGDMVSLLADTVIGNSYSRYQETRSDRDGLDFTYKMNGHVGCSLDFFKEENTITNNALQIFSTHPMTHFRIQNAEKYMEEKGYSVQECQDLVY